MAMGSPVEFVVQADAVDLCLRHRNPTLLPGDRPVAHRRTTDELGWPARSPPASTTRAMSTPTPPATRRLSMPTPRLGMSTAPAVTL
jgi:hypothetical protein